MSDRTYDQFGHRFIVPIAPAGVAMTGSGGSALAALAGTITQLPFACKLVAGNRVCVTGKSDAVAACSAVIVRSVGGTGSYFATGTFVYSGTNVTGAVGTAATIATGTAAEFAANDAAAIAIAIGTVAAAATHSFTLAFEELFN
jgi:hypothetical protein